MDKQKNESLDAAEKNVISFIKLCGLIVFGVFVGIGINTDLFTTSAYALFFGFGVVAGFVIGCVLVFLAAASAIGGE